MKQRRDVRYRCSGVAWYCEGQCGVCLQACSLPVAELYMNRVGELGRAQVEEPCQCLRDGVADWWTWQAWEMGSEGGYNSMMRSTRPKNKSRRCLGRKKEMLLVNLFGRWIQVDGNHAASVKAGDGQLNMKK